MSSGALGKVLLHWMKFHSLLHLSRKTSVKMLLANACGIHSSIWQILLHFSYVLSTALGAISSAQQWTKQSLCYHHAYIQWREIKLKPNKHTILLKTNNAEQVLKSNRVCWDIFLGGNTVGCLRWGGCMVMPRLQGSTTAPVAWNAGGLQYPPIHLPTGACL